MMSVYNIHENLIEVLLEMQSYPDVQAVLSKYDGNLFSLDSYGSFINVILKKEGLKKKKISFLDKIITHNFFSPAFILASPVNVIGSLAT